jgi:hypothetical protein
LAQCGTSPQRSSSIRLPSRSSTTASTSCVGAMLKRSKPQSDDGLDAERVGELRLDLVRPAGGEGVAAAHGGPEYEPDRSDPWRSAGGGDPSAQSR